MRSSYYNQKNLFLFCRYSLLGLVEDPSEFAMNGDSMLTNTSRDPINFNQNQKQKR